MKNKNIHHTDSGSSTENTSRSFYEPVYTIGVAANKLGLTVHLLRLYELEDLIIPFKTKTGRRLYSDLELEKVKCIRSMVKDNGLNFEGIRRIVSLVPCWKIRNCNSDEGRKCPAYTGRTTACWASDEKCLDPLPSCRDCAVYQKIASCEDVQRLIQSK
jgi:MerR family transcriptional regulator, heat shock protein HspR